MPLRVGPLDRGHRSRLREVLEATNSFEADEIDVALSLFDESYDDALDIPRIGPDGPEAYEFLGLFTPAGELVGYVCYGATPGTDRGYDIYWVAVHPEYQRSGGGAGLLAEVEQRLQAREARLLLVETSSREAYAATRRFYEGRGYERTARIRDFYALGDDRVLYTKRFIYPSHDRQRSG